MCPGRSGLRPPALNNICQSSCRCHRSLSTFDCAGSWPGWQRLPSEHKDMRSCGCSLDREDTRSHGHVLMLRKAVSVTINVGQGNSLSGVVRNITIMKICVQVTGSSTFSVLQNAVEGIDARRFRARVPSGFGKPGRCTPDLFVLANSRKQPELGITSRRRSRY